MWQQYPNLPWILYKPCNCRNGGFDALNRNTGQQVWAPDMDAVAQFAADNSRSPRHVPLGDAIHNVTKKLGIPRCGGCAKRQAAWNNAFRSRYR